METWAFLFPLGVVAIVFGYLVWITFLRYQRDAAMLERGLDPHQTPGPLLDNTERRTSPFMRDSDFTPFPPDSFEPPRPRGNFLAVVMIIAGALFLAYSFNDLLPEWVRYCAPGLAFLAIYAASRRLGFLVAGMLLSAIGLQIYLGNNTGWWSQWDFRGIQVAIFGCAFLLIAGIGGLVNRANLSLTAGAGVIFLLISGLILLRSETIIPPEYYNVLRIAAGLLLIVGGYLLISRRSPQ